MKERGLREIYANDPELAHRLLWSTPTTNRRTFLARLLGASSLAAIAPFARFFPEGMVPAAIASSEEEFITVKEGLAILNDRPLNAETPPYLLDDEFTPNHRHFVRNNGLPPKVTVTRDPGDWTLTIDGEVREPTTFRVAELTKFPMVDRALVIECAGNGRAGFHPPASGNQWTIGAVGCARYRGVRLKDVLESVGVNSSAVYTGYYGADTHLSGSDKKVPISRGTPIAKAMHPDTLLVLEMNGEPLPVAHGWPVRLICPGWPGSTGGKWLRRITLRDRVHDGAKMTGKSYRVPKVPVRPGTSVPDQDMMIIERMPVKSVITHPRTGFTVPARDEFEVRGHAWSGERSVTNVDVSIDFGQTWITAKTEVAVNPHAWQRWRARVSLPTAGYYELWARATDDAGEMQPMLVPGWNPKGYLNNAMHRIAIEASA